MDALNNLLNGLVVAAEPTHLLYAFIGVLLGTFIGVLPGIGPAMTLALLLPVTFSLEPSSALIMFAGIYYGGMYGGSTTSILLTTPGQSSSVMTAVEGNLMAKAGRAAPALATAAIGSFVAGTIATALLVFAAPAMVQVPVSLEQQDYFAIMVLAFVAVSTIPRRLGRPRTRLIVPRPNAQPSRHRQRHRAAAAHISCPGTVHRNRRGRGRSGAVRSR